MFTAIGFLIVLLVVILLIARVAQSQSAAEEVTRKAVDAPTYAAKEEFSSFSLPIGGGDSPGLNEPRTPYTLLNDALRPRMLGETAAANINSQRCYDTDYNAFHSLTGNFSKITNNNLPTYPDNCTGPRQEFTGTFYMPNSPVGTPPLGAGGNSLRRTG